MTIASQLREGMAVRIQGEVYKILEVDVKAGGGQLGGVVKTKLRNVTSGRMWEPHFRPDERLDNLELQKETMEFLYSDADNAVFMHPETYEQVEVPLATLGHSPNLLQAGMRLPVEFFDSRPISVLFPATVEARVTDTAPPAHSGDDTTWKEATLDNGLQVKVPLFIATGEVVRIDVKSSKYLERVREKKRSA